LHNLNAEIQSQVNDLDSALHILSQIADLFPNRTQLQQRAILLQMVERVVINPEGRILWLELKPPFSYLTTLVKGGSEIEKEKPRKAKVSGKADCSLHITLLAPNHIGNEPPPSLELDHLFLFAELTAYPQHPALEPLLAID